MAGTGDAVAAAEERRGDVSEEPKPARGTGEPGSPSGGGGDDAGGGSPDDASPRHHKEKKHKHKEKKHKHKEHKKEKRHHKEKRRHRDRSPGSDAEAEAGAADAPPAAEPAAPAVEGRGGEAPEPAAAPVAAKPAAAPAVAAGGDEDAEEGELPGEALPDGGDRGREERDERRRRSRSRSAGEEENGERRRRSRSRERRSRSRERQARSRSPQERPLRRDTSRAASEQQRSQQRDRSRDVSARRRSRSRSADRRRSRSPQRRRRSPSRSPDRRRDGRAALPPRVPDYRRDLDRDRDRRADYGRDRYGGPGGRYDDHRRVGFDDRRRRSRSRSRSRDGRKRSRSEERRAHRQKEEEEEDEEEFQRRVAAALEAQQGDDEDRLIEERRRRRQEILAKHRSQQDLSAMAAAPTATELAQRPQQEAQPPAEGQQAEGDGQPAAGAAGASAPPSAAGTPQRSRPASAAGAGGEAAGEDGEPEDLSDNEEAVMEQLGTTQAGALDIFRHDGAGPEAGPESAAPSELPKSGVGEAVDTELGRRVQARVTAEPDMFAEDDIFAATPTDVKEKEAAAAAAAAQAPGPNVPPAAGARKGLLDNYDDAEGYYNFQVGELIGEPGGPQYEVYATHGKGVFSSVLRARDLSRRDHDTGAIPEVAIKVIRANETMYKAGQMERVILRKLSEADVEGKRHCIRMLGSFEYRNHLCLVFEAMDMNLRELTKRYGRGIGLSINAVRVYAQQMLVSLYHLRNCGVLHADIKPDNILVNDRRTVVKLCDFGSAMFSGDNEITPYLVSRFYRAPEVILGLPYEYPMDMWSIGCVVYELFTGRILFPGKTNNEMLKLMMDVKGPFPKKMIKKAEFAFKHFEGDTNLSFALLEEDPVTKRPVRRLISNPTVKKDFGALLGGQSPDRRKLAQLIDLLERMMQLDPDKRITPKEALRHPFIKEPPAAPRAAAK